MGVFCRRDDARGLVDQVVDEAWADGQGHAVELDDVDLGVNPASEHRHVAVDRHPAVDDQVFADTARAHSAAGQYLL